MFEFFIALFGGLFYGNKYSREKSKQKAFEDKQSARMSTLESVRSRYVASTELERWAKDLILNGRNFEDICNWFAEDFRYVLGSDWKQKLRIPPNPMLHSGLSKNDAYSFCIPANHIYWVYHLLLAKQGKIDHGVPSYGYSIGGINEKDMNIKFAECIEGQLLNAGVSGIRLALELDDIVYGRRRSPSEVCGGHIKIETLSYFPTHRLWNDYIKK